MQASIGAHSERRRRSALALLGTMPQEQVSLELGVPQQTLSRWLEGDTSNSKLSKASAPSNSDERGLAWHQPCPISTIVRLRH